MLMAAKPTYKIIKTVESVETFKKEDNFMVVVWKESKQWTRIKHKWGRVFFVVVPGSIDVDHRRKIMYGAIPPKNHDACLRCHVELGKLPNLSNVSNLVHLYGSVECN